MAAMKFYFGYIVSITTYYVGLWPKLSMLCLYEYISVFEQKKAPKLKEIVLAPFRKRNSFNNPRKYGKFGIDLVDPLLNTLRTLELANVSQLFIST